MAGPPLWSAPAKPSTNRSPSKRMTMARPKSLERMVTLRVSEALVERILELREPLTKHPELAPKGTLSQSDLLRLCLIHGAQALEERYPASKSAKRRRRS